MSIGFYIILHHSTLYQELPKISLYALSFSPGGFLLKASCHKWEAILFHHLPPTKFLVFSKFLILAFPKLSNKKKQVSTFNVLCWMIFDCVTDTCVFSQGILMCLIHRMHSDSHPFLTNNSRTKTCHHRDLWWSVSRSGEKKNVSIPFDGFAKSGKCMEFFRKSAKQVIFLTYMTGFLSTTPPSPPHTNRGKARRCTVYPWHTWWFLPLHIWWHLQRLQRHTRWCFSRHFGTEATAYSNTETWLVAQGHTFSLLCLGWTPKMADAPKLAPRNWFPLYTWHQNP